MLLREKKRYREFNFERFMLSLFLFLMYNNLWSDIMKMNDVDIELNYVRKKNPKRGTELCRRWCEGNSVPKNEDFIKMQVFFNDFNTL